MLAQKPRFAAQKSSAGHHGGGAAQARRQLRRALYPGREWVVGPRVVGESLSRRDDQLQLHTRAQGDRLILKGP